MNSNKSFNLFLSILFLYSIVFSSEGICGFKVVEISENEARRLSGFGNSSEDYYNLFTNHKDTNDAVTVIQDIFSNIEVVNKKGDLQFSIEFEIIDDDEIMDEGINVDENNYLMVDRYEKDFIFHVSKRSEVKNSSIVLNAKDSRRLEGFKIQYETNSEYVVDQYFEVPSASGGYCDYALEYVFGSCGTRLFYSNELKRYFFSGHTPSMFFVPIMGSYEFRKGHFKKIDYGINKVCKYERDFDGKKSAFFVCDREYYIYDGFAFTKIHYSEFDTSFFTALKKIGMRFFLVSYKIGNTIPVIEINGINDYRAYRNRSPNMSIKQEIYGYKNGEVVYFTDSEILLMRDGRWTLVYDFEDGYARTVGPNNQLADESIQFSLKNTRTGEIKFFLFVKES